MKRVIYHQNKRIGDFVCARAGGTYTEGECIGLERDGELIAGVLFDRYNGASICMHVASSEKNWLTREFLHACFYYPFEFLQVNKVIGIVDSDNEQARKFDEHLGFVLEATIKYAGKDGCDMMVFSMMRDQCRFLQLKAA